VTAAQRPVFSVVIPTRNRSAVLVTALNSVVAQRFSGFEIIVVNDGSSSEHETPYRMALGAAPQARMVNLRRTKRGHGPSYGRNAGAAEAEGDYLCFLDDDDQWTDPQHLARVAEAIGVGPEGPDLILANQQAFRDGAPAVGAIWIEDLKMRLRRAPDNAGAYAVTPAELLECSAHCHLNTTIVARAFFAELGGFDEGLRYEEDRDFYLRAIDRARLIKHLPVTVSRHNIPDPAAKSSASTIEPELLKHLHRLRVFDNAVLRSARPELRRYAMRQRAHVLKHIATEAARIGQLDCAVYYAREALMAGPTVGWFAMTALYTLRRLLPARTAAAFQARVAAMSDRRQISA
jgi:glycosyltransferase involved in cell wall biosynthesis